MATPPKAKTAAPDETDRSWIEHAQEDIQKEPERLEETAKFLAGVVSISLTIFLSNPSEESNGWFAAAALIWMLSVLLSFFVLFPWRYRFHPESPEGIRSAYRRIAGTKRRLLIGSLACFFVALGLAVFAFLMG